MAAPSAPSEPIWTLEHRVAPRFEFQGEWVTVRGVRDFCWRSLTDYDARWEDRSFRLTELSGLWYVVTPFVKAWRGLAHTLLSFQFGQDRFLTLSVEARRREGQRYGFVKGMFRQFGLIYVVGTEEDVLVHRAIHRDHELLLFPVKIGPDRLRELFLRMARSANQLRENPEFYHTLSNNCTTRIVDHVNAVVPERIPGGWRILFPGHSDELARGLGLLDVEGSIDDARQRWRANQRIRQWEGSPDFSVKIREGVG
ncbi:MAG: DUF4105 domain-containing protein [Gemmatimonadota bacterium]